MAVNKDITSPQAGSHGRTHRSTDALLALMTAKTVVDLGGVREALAGASRATAFRWLAQIPHITSYNHNGRFYALDVPGRFDRFGLFQHGDVRFCRDASLDKAVVRLVQEAEAGRTQRELQDLFHVRVQPFLLAGVRRGAIGRQLLDGLFLYLHADREVQQAQLTRRQALVARATQPLEVPDAVVIEILLLLLHHPGAEFAEVVRRLGRRSPPISPAQVRAIFTRYDLDSIGAKKGGP